MMSQSDLVDLKSIAAEFRAAARLPGSPLAWMVELAQLADDGRWRAVLKDKQEFKREDMPVNPFVEPGKWVRLPEYERLSVAVYYVGAVADIQNPAPILGWPCSESWGVQATKQQLEFWQARWVMRLPVYPTRHSDEWQARLVGKMAVGLHEVIMSPVLLREMWEYTKGNLVRQNGQRNDKAPDWYTLAKLPANTPGVHPTESLLRSLRMLELVARDCRLFAELARSRGITKIQRANALKFDLEFEVFARLAAAPLQDAPPATYSLLKEIASVGLAYCEAAQRAIRDGGGRSLDRSREGTAALSRSEVHATCSRAHECLRRLRDGLGDWSVLLAVHANEMAVMAHHFSTWANALQADTDVYGLEGPSMDSASAASELMAVARDKLWKAQARAERLADQVVKLAKLDREYPEFFDGDYSIECDEDDDCKLDPQSIAYPDNPTMVTARAETIDAVFHARSAIDGAIKAVANIAPFMDGDGTAPEKWSFKAIDELRLLRGVLGKGAIPKLDDAELPSKLRAGGRAIRERWEDVKTRILQGVAMRVATPPLNAGLPPARNLAGVAGTRSWKAVQNELLGMRARNEPFTDFVSLGASLGCSEGLVRKAVGRSVELKGWVARAKRAKKRQSAKPLDDVVLDRTRANVQGPDEYLPQDDVELVFSRLLQQAKGSEREKLLRYSAEQKATLVKCLQDQRSDDDGNPLLDGGARRSNRRLYKQA